MKTINSACKMFLFFGIFNLPGTAYPQVVLTESFHNTYFPPLGWSAGKVSGADINNYTERVTAGTSPVCVPHSGAGMVRYRSGFMFNSGEQSYLASPRYDLTNNPGTAQVSFWLYKDNINAVKDSITVYVNDSAAVSASKGSMTRVMGPFTRDSAGFNGWKQYSAVIPPGYNTSSVYLVFVFTNRETSGSGANMYLDDIAVQTFPKPAVFVKSKVFYQETANAPKGVPDMNIIGIRVVVDGAGDSLRLDSIVTNATGTSNLSDIFPLGTRLWYTKGTNSFITTASNQFGVGQFPSFFRDKFLMSNFYLENGDNYFWLTYSTSVSGTTGNVLDAELVGVYYRKTNYTGPDTSKAPVVTSLPGNRVIGLAYCNGVIPSYTEGTSYNDYINRVYLKGANILVTNYPFLDNNLNDFGPATAPWNGGPAPFSVHPPDYQLFSPNANALHPNISAVLQQGIIYSAPVLVGGNPIGAGLAMQCGTWSTANYMAAWIDFNADGDFFDVAEQVHQSGPMNGSTWTFAPILVPAVVTPPTPGISGPSGVQYGHVTMRVREAFAVPGISPCQSGYTYGETEDYTLSVIPACSLSVKLWLGYSDDWNTAGNWCNGIPVAGDIAVIDRSINGYLNYHHPVIHSNTTAIAKTIRISDQDTLEVNAPTGSSLQVLDSLVIAENAPFGSLTGLFKITSSFADTAQLGSGNLGFNITPFQATRKQMKMQLVYKKSELLSLGMSAGDEIDQLTFHIRSKNNPTVIYNNFSIKWAYADNAWSSWPSVPVSLASVSSPYTIIYGPANFDLQAQVPGTQGSFTLNLIPGQLVWDGLHHIVLEICYDNALVSLPLANDLVYQTTTLGSNQTMWLNSTLASPSGCALDWPLPLGVTASASQYRPNITLHFHRPYKRFPVYISGNGFASAGTWVNNSNFEAGFSVVTFSNASQHQHLGGANSSRFNKLKINKAGGYRLILDNAAIIDSFLVLQSGKLELNKNTITISNPSPDAIDRQAGGIISESTSPPYGTIKWKINGNTAKHVFPFITSTSNYIPFSYKVTSGNAGNISVATYPANNNILPYPTGVNNVDDSLGNDNADYTVHRFWIYKMSGPGTSANMTFSYKNSEAPAPIVKANLKANRYEYSTNLWQRFTLPVSTSIGGTVSSVTINNVSGASLANAVWALSDASSPLRISDNTQPLAGTYPSPFSETFTVYWEGEDFFELRVYDLSGRIIHMEHVAGGTTEIAGDGWLPGVYTIFVMSSRITQQLKVVKTR